MNTFLQGTAFRWPVAKDDCSMILFDGVDKIVLSAVIDRCIWASAEETAQWKASDYQYQVISAEDGLLDEGMLTVQRNLMYAQAGEETKSRARVVLEAIEAVLEGRASTGQASIHVGDKGIGYMSIDELLKLKDYYQGLVDKEEGKFDKNSEMQIKYVWRLR